MLWFYPGISTENQGWKKNKQIILNDFCPALKRKSTKKLLFELIVTGAVRINRIIIATFLTWLSQSRNAFNVYSPSLQSIWTNVTPNRRHLGSSVSTLSYSMAGYRGSKMAPVSWSLKASSQVNFRFKTQNRVDKTVWNAPWTVQG